jgi:hypothetical protein
MNRHDAYYARLFQDDPLYSTPYPNLEEARRWAKMAEFLSRLAASRRHGAQQPLRIALQHVAATYQVWWFMKEPDPAG